MNKRVLLAVLLSFMIVGLIFPEDEKIDPPFVPLSPEVMAQGGAFVANAHGYNALFYNPAGFAMPGRSFTVISSSAWIHANPSRFFQAVTADGSDELADFVDEAITSGGLGFGFSGGVAFVGKGLGLGTVLNVDSYLYGPTPIQASGNIHATVAFIGGLALPVNLFGIKFILGADLRPMIRVIAPLDCTGAFDILNAVRTGGDPLAALNSVDAMHGFGLGIDLGGIVELGRLKLGLSVRDFLGTPFSYTQNNFEDILSSLRKSLTFPKGGSSVSGYSIPMDITIGAAYHPDFGSLKRFIDPVVHADLSNLVGFVQDSRSPWTHLHIGTEIELLSLFKLRAGLNQGYITIGGGFELLFMDLNWALFAREMGENFGDRKSSGLTVEAAIRF